MYKQLISEQRSQIFALLQRKTQRKEIARIVGISLWGKIISANSLMDYVACCSTLLSITLSIFAIQYTYTSNNEVQHQFEKINSAAENVSMSSKAIMGTKIKLDENLG